MRITRTNTGLPLSRAAHGIEHPSKGVSGRSRHLGNTWGVRSRVLTARHQPGNAEHGAGCKLGLEGIVSKRSDAPYAPGNHGPWVKTKCLNRQEFVVVGWTDPEGARPYFGGTAARLLRRCRQARL